MNQTLKAFALCMLFACLVACASTPAGGAGSRGKLTGVYSDMQYNDQGGDVVGVEIFLVMAEGRYYAVYQSSEGEPAVPVVLPADVTGSGVTFQVPASVDARGTFTGTIGTDGLTGTFSGNQQRVVLKRRPSYWQ